MGLIKQIHMIADTVANSDAQVVESFSNYLTPVIAILAFIIAYQQYRINKQRFLFETYERRLEIFDALQAYLIDIRTHGKTYYDKIGDFRKNTSNAVFLFDKTIQKKIKEIYENSYKMVELEYQLYPRDGSEGLPIGEE